jgi:aspartyl-tRNA(Asn)/glutamyl-tRNA(Gln) amidotransferase subunit A
MRDYVPTHTATALTKLDAAGAIDLGRLAMGEFAVGASGHNEYAGTARNPWNRDHLAGGTSGGPAAAVAARLVPAALASDTGGSTRLPAASCGIVGFK